MSTATWKIMFPEYIQFHSRLNSFKKSLPNSFVSNTKWVFSEAGFFHTGIEDQTICYHCGGGLRDWQEGDDPWEEHARWFSRCPFVIIKKGQEFVNEHRNKASRNIVVNREISSTKSFMINEPEVTPGLECIVCLSSGRDIVFFPCKHCCTCSTCGLSVDNCVYCRAPITSIMRVFIV